MQRLAKATPGDVVVVIGGVHELVQWIPAREQTVRLDSVRLSYLKVE